MGQSRPFDAASHDSFQRMMERFGHPESQAVKRRVLDAVNAGKSPEPMTQDRHLRACIRIALRQMKAAGHASAALKAWLESFDQAGLEHDGDELAVHHDG